LRRATFPSVSWRLDVSSPFFDVNSLITALPDSSSAMTAANFSSDREIDSFEPTKSYSRRDTAAVDSSFLAASEATWALKESASSLAAASSFSKLSAFTSASSILDFKFIVEALLDSASSFANASSCWVCSVTFLASQSWFSSRAMFPSVFSIFEDNSSFFGVDSSSAALSFSALASSFSRRAIVSSAS